jgi:hypothetical protein
MAGNKTVAIIFPRVDYPTRLPERSFQFSKNESALFGGQKVVNANNAFFSQFAA